MSKAETIETLGFQTEARQLLHLMIHSLYSHNVLFLRELISNGSDACDKLRFEALANADLYENDSDLQIRIDVDEKAGTISVSDNGIGMSRDEVIDNLGTIAKSGTSEFLKSLSGDQKKDSQLIGQFGVGFYSSFIVADRVTVLTRRAGLAADQAVLWTCAGEAQYQIAAAYREERGTTITLHLKEEKKEFGSPWRLRSIIKKYSDHLAVPVMMKKKVDVDDSKADAEAESETQWETVNSAKALWVRPRSEISDDDYKAFYQHVSHDFSPPMRWLHNRVEGKLEYTSLLYFPSKPPFDLYQREAPRGLKLYVQRTFIMDDAEQFLPLYLRFIKGVVDSNDLPLNVSREILQNSPAVDSIRTGLTKRVLDALEKMAQDSPEDYSKFWENFGTVLKEGPAEDFANREKIAQLLRFASTHNQGGEETVSINDYIGRMKDGQDKIFYLIADSHTAASSSPYLEVFRKNGVEVLLLSDRIDEWLMSHLREFEGKAFQDVSRGELDLSKFTGETDTAADDDDKKDTTDVAATLKSLLGEKVADVRTTRRLTESPACLVLSDGDIGVQMRRILEAAGQEVPESKPVLEINPSHPLVRRLGELGEDKSSDLANILFDQAVLASGDQLADPALFVQRLNRLLLQTTG